MDAQMIALVIAGGGVLGLVVWLLAQLGKVLIKAAEALAAAAAVLFIVWLLIKAVVWALRQVALHWRTSLAVVGVLAWCRWWGWASLAITIGAVVGCSSGGGWPTWGPSRCGR